MRVPNIVYLPLILLAPAVLFFAIKTGKTHSETRTFAAGDKLLLILPRGDVSIKRSSDPNHLLLRYTPKSLVSAYLEKVQVHFTNTGGETKIEFVAPISGEITTEIQVPDPALLDIEVGGGDVNIEGINGDKRVHIGAGNIKVFPVADYHLIEASTRVGSIFASDFGQPRSTGLVGKILSVNGNGRYGLNLSVNAGDISVKR